MAWYTRYQHEWKSVQNDNSMDLQIQSEVSGPIIEPNGMPNPVQIIMPDKDRFDTVKSTGLNIKLQSQTDRQLEGLFAAGDKEYRVLLYQDSTLKWFGYLNSEQYAEPWSEIENYGPVNLYAADGFQLLDKQLFLDDSGNKYVGLKTQWEVLVIILGKWGLKDLLDYIRVALTTTATGVTIQSAETLFHVTKVKMANYYKEDGVAMSCKEVLDAILKPYAAHIEIKGTTLYIIDTDSIANLGSEYKSYTNNPNYLAAGNLTHDNINNIGYHATGGTYELKPAYQRSVVRYNKYKSPNKFLIDPGEITATSSLQHDTATVRGEACDYWYESADHPTLLILSYATCSLYGYRQEETDESEFMITLDDTTNLSNTVVASSSYSDGYYIIGNNSHYLQLKGSMRPRWGRDPYNPKTRTSNPKDSTKAKLGVYLSIGNKTWDGSAWSTTTFNTSQRTYLIVGDGETKVADTWWNIHSDGSALNNFSLNSNFPATGEEDGILINVPIGINGYVTMSYTPYVRTYKLNSDENWIQTSEYVDMYGVDLKDLEIGFVGKGDLDPDTQDILYDGYVTASWSSYEKETVLTHGTSYSTIDGATSVDNGGLINNDTDAYFARWIRGGNTAPIEELLVESILSNNQSGSKCLSGITLNCTSSIQDIILTDPTYLTGSIFMAGGYTLDPTEESIKYNLIEVKKDGTA